MPAVYGFIPPLARLYLLSYLERSVGLEPACCGRLHLTSAMPTPQSMTKRQCSSQRSTDPSYFFAIQWTMVATGSAIGAFIAFGYK
jgi:hypothetical protein